MSTCLASLPTRDLPQPARRRTSSRTRRRILVVDDDPGVLQVLEALLERLDVDVEACLDPEAAVARFETDDFDVVISDDRMPKISGRELLRRVRSLRPETPTILLTGFTSPRGLDEAYEQAGVFRYVGKPFDGGELIATIREALRARQAVTG
jgi:two-component system NtrC family response regulator